MGLIVRSVKISYASSPFLYTVNMLLILAGGLSNVISIYMTQYLVNAIQFFEGEFPYYVIFIYAAVMIVFELISSLTSFLYQKMSLKLENHLNLLMADKLSKLKLKYFENETSYELITRANDMGKNKLLELNNHLPMLIQNIISMASVILLIAGMNYPCWYLIVIVPIFYSYFNLKLGRYSYDMEKNNVKNYRLSDYINYLLSNNIARKEILSYDIGNFLKEKYENAINKVLKNHVHISGRYALNNAIFGILEVFIMVFIIIKMIFESLKERFGIGDIIGYVYSLKTIEGNIENLLNSVAEIYKDKIYLEDFFEFMDINIQESRVGKVHLDEEIKELEIKNLSFSYSTGQNVLKGINFIFEKGRLYAIIGENGAGKSTLVKLLSGLYAEYSGDILINGKNKRDFDADSLKGKITVMFQDFNKYEFNLRDNLTLGNNSIEDLDLNMLLEALKLPEDLDMQMGNWFGGEELSIGEWQKTAFIRAILRKAEVMIFDEPTASLDKNACKFINDYLFELAQKKIVIVITHRPEDLSKYDTCYIHMDELKRREIWERS